MEKIKLAILLGTTRSGAWSEKVAHHVREVAENHDNFEVKLVDPKALNMPGDGRNDEDKDHSYTELVDWAEAFVIVTPEYNHSYPGSLKRMLDQEFANYSHKVVGLVGVSNGIFGGSRAVEALMPVLHHLGLLIAKPAVAVPNVDTDLDESGKVRNEKALDNLNNMLAEVEFLTRAMRLASEPQG